MSDARPIAVAMRGITKRFPGVVALDNVSLAVGRGEVHAICGENGAGKSTLMKILSGVYRPDDGVLEIDGEPRRFAGTREAEAAGVAIIHQELNLVEELSVAANIFLGRERRTRLGLLDDVPACTDLTSKPWVQEAGTRVLDQPFFARGNVATAGGCLASVYLAAWVAARLAGVDQAREALHYIAPVGEKEQYLATAMAAIGRYLPNAT